MLTDGERVVLQHRAPWSHLGGTWALPGGALHPGETPVQGALREAAEEAGVDAASVRVLATSALHHPDWSYTTVIARATPGTPVAATDHESLAIAWSPVEAVTDRPLLPAFADAWPTLRSMLDGDPTVVVDGANVVGSRPDGWWRDRRGAAERLLSQLDDVAGRGVPADLLGLPGETWWPSWHLVTEGAARGVESTERVAVTSAPGSGDDTIVDVVRAELTAGRTPVQVVTADRELRGRLAALGAGVIGPAALLALL